MTNEEKMAKSLRALSGTSRKIDGAVAENLDSAASNQIAVLSFLCDNSERDIYQRDIEKEFHLRRSTVSGILKEMEELDMITRTAVTLDARLKKVLPTEKGKAIFNSAEKEALPRIKSLIENITDEELDLFCLVADELSKKI